MLRDSVMKLAQSVSAASMLALSALDMSRRANSLIRALLSDGDMLRIKTVIQDNMPRRR